MRPIKLLLLAILLATVFRADVAAQQSGSCKCNETPIGEAFTVHGRLSLSNGNPSVRIWIVGTKRILGVRGGERPNMPESLFKMLNWDTDIFGNFVVCPLTKSRPGHMQMVCIESADNLVVKKRR